jgi:glycosyltransferase involved in cell wall biosynthesis
MSMLDIDDCAPATSSTLRSADRGQAGTIARGTICQVLHGLQVGGAEVLAAQLARQLQGRYRFVFACLDELGTLGESLKEEGFTIELLERRPGVDVRCARRLDAFLRREQVSLLHSHQYTPFFYSLLARLIYRRAPVLMTEHGRTFPDFRRPKRVLANRILLERRDRVVAVGKAVRHALVENEGLPAERVEVIYNGVNLAAFANGVHDRAAIRSKLGVGMDDFVIVQVARLDRLKDHSTAIRALRRIVDQRRNVRLLLAGDGPELAAITELVEAAELTSNVRILGLRRDVARLFAAADLCLLTSVSEGIPLVLIEAMGARLPVVATRVGGVSEVVEDTKTGLLAPAGNDVALAAAILRLVDDSSARERMGSLGLARAQAWFTERVMHAEYRQLYDEMLSAPAPKRATSPIQPRTPVPPERRDRPQR